MSRVLSHLLAATEPHFSRAISDLEEATGRKSVDVALTATIVSTVHRKMRELGLDPTDTTGQELYHCLQALVAKHDAFLSKAIGTDAQASASEQLQAIANCANSVDIPRATWAIKHSVLKRLAKANPPKKVMKVLGYRSIDSMLKREPIEELLAAGRCLESATWNKKLVSSYKKLTPGDFETRAIQVVLLSDSRWGKAFDTYIAQSKQNIGHLKEAGIIVILPLPVHHLRGAVITILPLVLHYINEIRMYSTFFKMQQVRPDFGQVVVDALLHDNTSTVKFAGQDVHWRIIQRHFGGQDPERHPELFEPHVQPDDFHWRKAESVLYWLEPALQFWEELDYVAALFGQQIVSLSLLDNAVSYCNGLDYGQQFTGHFQASLWNEIYQQYIGREQFEHQVLEQLNEQVLRPEGLEL